MLTDYNVEAEQSVIGSMLIEARCIGSVLAELADDDFSATNQPIVAMIRRMFSSSVRIDAVTLIAALVRGGGDADQLRDYIMQIVDVTPTAANVMEYAGLVRESSRVRRMHDVAEMMLKAKSSDAITRAMEHMAELSAGRSTERIRTAADMSAEFFNWLDDSQPQRFLPTTIPQLDRQLMLEGGMYVVLGGFPSDGKTMLALQMAMEWAKTMKVGLFFYEGSTLQAVRRMYSAFTGISFSAIRKRKLTDRDYIDLMEFQTAFDSMGFEAIEATGFRASDIRAMTAARGYDVVIIDYIQLVEPENWRDDETRAVTRTSKAIRSMTVQLGCLTLALSQFHRLGNGVRRAPTMSDLRQSGQIEQDANVILLLSEAGVSDFERGDGYNADNIPENAEGRLLQIAKNREGVRDGWMHMLMYGDLQRFVYYNPSAAPMPEPPYYQTGFSDMGYGDFPGR